MKALYPGLKVKVARNVGDPQFNWTIGMTGVIEYIFEDEGLCCLPGHRVKLHGRPLFERVMFHPEDLEPIEPDLLRGERVKEAVTA